MRFARACVLLVGVVLAVSSCVATEIEPIPGSITYGGQPRTKLTKSPIGSTFTHLLTDDYGCQAQETYRIEPDRSLRLLSRSRLGVSEGLSSGC
jgi:hypothetical protein